MFRVLLIDDNPADTDLFQECLGEAQIRVTVAHSVTDGLSALRADADDPIHLVLLDLYLPQTGGLDALKKIRSEPRHELTPIIVVSSSDLPADIAAAYDLGANCYVRKPDSLDGLRSIVHSIEHHWLEGTVRLPIV